MGAPIHHTELTTYQEAFGVLSVIVLVTRNGDVYEREVKLGEKPTEVQNYYAAQGETDGECVLTGHDLISEHLQAASRADGCPDTLRGY